MLLFFSNFLFPIFGGISVVNQPGTGFRYIYYIQSRQNCINFWELTNRRNNKEYTVNVLCPSIRIQRVTLAGTRNTNIDEDNVSVILLPLLLLLENGEDCACDPSCSYYCSIIRATEIQEHLQSVVCLIISMNQTKKVITYCNKARTIELHFPFFP